MEIPVTDEEDEEEVVEDESEADEELVHESVKPKSKKKEKAKKYIPINESQADRDRRTIFVGNLSLEVAKSKVSFSEGRPPVV